MKKNVSIVLLLAIVSLVPVSAETWEQYRNRVMRVSNAVFDAIGDPTFRMDSNDRIGAVWATHRWCYNAFQQILRNAPGLTQQDQTRYRISMMAHRVRLDEIEPLIRSFSTSTFNNIVARFNHWTNHLNNGGTIRFQ